MSPPFDRELTEYVDYPVHMDRLLWLWDRVKEVAETGRQVNVLDIGCGTGNITIPLGAIKGSRILGIDIHQPNVDISTARNPLSNVRFENRPLQEVDLAEFDLLIMTEVLEHIGPYPEILQYIARHMNPAARFLVTIPNGRGPFEISQIPVYLLRRFGMGGIVSGVKRLLGKEEPYSQNYETPHVNFFTLSRMRRELLQYGLQLRGVRHSFVVLPIIETYLPFYRMHGGLVRADRALAQNLPAALVSGWYLEIGLDPRRRPA
ncbi:MAG: class I SAM-dependent methyltransferase [Candidatus Marinimicrobia bacterium]|nr:class I SAM-dependent methyltransferase [Candidatus Neomarinimicrobiota bacterium]